MRKRRLGAHPRNRPGRQRPWHPFAQTQSTCPLSTAQGMSAWPVAWLRGFRRVAPLSRPRASASPGESPPSLFSVARRTYASARSDGKKRTANFEPPLFGVGTAQLSPNILLRCTILDSKGSVKSISGLFSKSELCSHHGLEPRDLRKIDSRVPNLVPTILARRSGTLINILHIRAMIKSDAVLLFDSYGANDTRLNSAFVYNLEYNLRPVSYTHLRAHET